MFVSEYSKMARFALHRIPLIISVRLEMPLQLRQTEIIGRLLFLIGIAIQIYWFVQIILSTTYYYDVLLFPFCVFISIFFISSALHNIAAIAIPPGWLKTNSIYLSTYPETETNLVYPSLTIVIPVYNEDFATVIRPTIDRALTAVRNYTTMTKACANIVVADDSIMCDLSVATTRLEYYYNHRDILFISDRPVEGRRGKFKKAGNVNYALSMYSEVIGDIILIIDSDSCIPCELHKIMCEFTDPRVALVQAITISMIDSTSKPSFWTRAVAHFTDNIYTLSFRLVTAFGDPSPFVGHNAFIRQNALSAITRHPVSYVSNARNVQHESCDIAYTNLGYSSPTIHEVIQYFSEDHVSEDFELSTRLQAANYTIRYCTYIEGFEEGVTFTPTDEIIRLNKYAYGVSELLFNPINVWFTKGIFNQTIKAYLLSPAVSLTTKYNIIGYAGTYYALAISPCLVLANYFAYHYSEIWRTTMINSENILYGCICVFTILTPIATIILKKKLGIRMNIGKEILYGLLFGIFFAGIGWHLLVSLLSHMLSMNTGWGATNKSMPTNKDIFKSILRLWPVYIISMAELIMIGVCWWLLDLQSWQAIVPLAISASAHILIPFIAFI